MDDLLWRMPCSTRFVTGIRQSVCASFCEYLSAIHQMSLRAISLPVLWRTCLHDTARQSIDAVESEARSRPRFRELLSGLWRNVIREDVLGSASRHCA